MFNRYLRTYVSFWGRELWRRLRYDQRGGIDDYVAKVVMILVVVLGISVVIGANQSILGRIEALVQNFLTATDPTQDPVGTDDSSGG